MKIGKSPLVSAIILGALTLVPGTSRAAQVFAYAPIFDNSSNFTMLSPLGGMVGGTNDIAFSWDGSIYTANSDYTGPGGASNASLSSSTPFFGVNWAAHDVQMFGPGTYTFNTALGGGNPEAGILTMNVGSSQIGMHLLFDWSGNLNIDMALVLDTNAIFGSGRGYLANPAYCGAIPDAVPGSNCLWDGKVFGPAGAPSDNRIWTLASLDADGDGTPGIPMTAGGPFAGFNANFNLAPVPVPAAFWLFGSGLAGMLGLMRRRKR